MDAAETAGAEHEGAVGLAVAELLVGRGRVDHGGDVNPGMYRAGLHALLGWAGSPSSPRH